MQTKLAVPVWVRSLCVWGAGGPLSFVLFCNVVSSRGSCIQQQGRRLAQCSTGLKSGFGLEQHQTGPDQAGTVFLDSVIYCMYVFWSVDWQWTLLLEHKAEPFIYLSRQDVDFVSHPHSHMNCTSSTFFWILNIHDTYIKRRRWVKLDGFLCLISQRNSTFRNFHHIKKLFLLTLSVHSFIDKIFEFHIQYSESVTWSPHLIHFLYI